MREASKDPRHRAWLIVASSNLVNVPPYVPQPIEIPGNVAEESYVARLQFLRRVVVLFGVSIIAIVLTSFISIDVWPYDLVIVFASLLLLSITRAIAKGRAVEQRLSLLVAPALFIGLGMLIRDLEANGWPMWILAVGIVCAIAYTLSCGRDLSFLGLWFVAVAASIVISLALAYAFKLRILALTATLAINVAFLSYWVYDLAALLTRRRIGEEIGAVLDLYRDVLNMFSYPIRVLHHWRTHKIWSRP